MLDYTTSHIEKIKEIYTGLRSKYPQDITNIDNNQREVIIALKPLLVRCNEKTLSNNLPDWLAHYLTLGEEPNADIGNVLRDSGNTRAYRALLKALDTLKIDYFRYTFL